MSVSLQKSQQISLGKSGSKLTKVFMGLGWDPLPKKKGLFGGLIGGSNEIDLDASVVSFGSSGEHLSTVYFGKLTDFDKAIRHGGDNLTGDGDGDDERIYIDLSKLPSRVKTLVFMVNSFRGQTFDEVGGASCRLVDEVTGKEIATIALSSKGSHTGIIMAKLTREQGDWTMTSIAEAGQGKTFQDMFSQIQSKV